MKLDAEFSSVDPAQGGAFVPPPPGPHIFKVVGVSDKPSKAGNDMVTLELDIAEGEHKGAFERFPKRYFQLVNGDNIAYFKGMIEAFRASNDAKKMAKVVKGLDFNPEGLVDLVIGGNLREVEYLNAEQNLAVGLEIAYLVPVSELPKLKVLPIKKLPRQAGTQHASSGASSSSASKAGAAKPEDDLPF